MLQATQNPRVNNDVMMIISDVYHLLTEDRGPYFK